MTFGEKIKLLRTRENLTQNQLAKLAGISLRTVINYENNGKIPKNKSVYSVLAEVLKTDVDYLLTDKAGDYKQSLSRSFSKTPDKKEEILLKEITVFFNDSNQSEESKDDLFRLIQEAYWKRKLKNKQQHNTKKDRPSQM